MLGVSPVVVNDGPRGEKDHRRRGWRVNGHQHLPLLVHLRLCGGCDGSDGGQRRRRHAPEENFQRFPELPPHQAVQDGVQAAVGVRQAHGHGEHVHLHGVVVIREGNHVEFDEDAPGCQRLIGQPAEEKWQNYDGDGPGDFGAPFGAGSVYVFGGDEAQKQQVAGWDDCQGHHETQQHFLGVVESQPELRGAVGFWEFNEAQVLPGNRGGGGKNGVRQRGGDGGDPDEEADAARGAAVRPPPPALQRGGQGAVARHAHGRQEKHAGVHVHSCHIRDNLTHGFPERPGEVQRVLHSPKRQRQYELEVRQRQTSYEKVDGGFSPHVLRLH